MGPDPRPPLHDPPRSYFTLLHALSIAAPNTIVLEELSLGDDVPPHARRPVLESVARSREPCEIERMLGQ